MKLSLVLLFTSISLSACGGATSAQTPVESAPSNTSSASTSEPEPEPEPAGPDCSDGTCFVCGEGVCPVGAYCDSGAPKGPACAWIAECPKSPSCACLKKTLGSECSCEESGGGPLVRCN